MPAWLKLLGGAVLFGIALALLDWGHLWDGLGKVRLSAMAMALLIMLTIQLVLAVRWILLLNHQVKIPVAAHFRIYLWGMFLNSITPANLGADAYRVTALRSSSDSIAPLIVAVLQERLLGLAIYLITVPVCLLLYAISSDSRPTSEMVLAGLAAIAAIVAIVAAAPLLRLALRFPGADRWSLLQRILQFGDRSVSLRRIPSLARVIGLSIGGWLLWFALVLLIARSIGLALPASLLGAIVSLVEISRLIPLTFQGVGLREGAFALLVAHAGGDPELGFLLGALAYLVVSLAMLLAAPLSQIFRLFEPGGAPASR